MSKNVRTSQVDHLYEAILCLKDKSECYAFFEDICTVKEIETISQRYEVAKMLRKTGHILILRKLPEHPLQL